MLCRRCRRRNVGESRGFEERVAAPPPAVTSAKGAHVNGPVNSSGASRGCRGLGSVPGRE